jgi:hypothetical protein
MATRLIGFLILLSTAVACIEPYEINDSKPTNTLVVEAVISNQMKKHQVLLSRASASFNDKTLKREEGAVVTIADGEGSVVSLTEERPGVYVTPEFAAEPGKSYTLHIKTTSGRQYASRGVLFNDGPDIGALYAKYVQKDELKGIEIYVDTEDPKNQAHFFRWDYIDAYEVHAPFPSNWIWLGGNNVEFRHDGIDTCYVTDTLRNILIRSTNGLEQDKITGQAIRFIPDYSYALKYRYGILVQQFSLSEEGYSYWENLRTISERQGSLSDVQPGSLPGNISCITDDDETVIGYFEVCKVSEKRLFTSALDFYDEGFETPVNFRSFCYDIPAIEIPEIELGENMPKYEQDMYIWEVYGFSPFAVFELMPKYCCDCRDQGPTEPPHFFE